MRLQSSEAATDVPGDAAPIIPNINMDQNRPNEVGPFHHRRPQPKHALLGIAGGEGQCQGTTLSALAMTPRVAMGPGSIRWPTRNLWNVWGGGGGTKRPNNQPAEILKKKKTLPGGQGQDFTLLSPSPAIVGSSDQSAGQRNC